MPAFHVSIATSGRTTLFPEADALRAAVRTLVRVAGKALRLFCIVDDHVHLVANASTRSEAGLLAGAVARAFVWRNAELQPAYVREVEGRRHLETLVSYLVRQPAKHGVRVHPALWDGSCLPDLVGARVVAGFDPQGISRDLPRFDVLRAAILAAGLTPDALRLLPNDEIRVLGPERLWACATAACAIPVAPQGKDATVLASRGAFCRLARDVGIGTVDARAASGLPETTWRRAAAAEADPRLVDAIRMRGALEAAADGRLVSTEGPNEREPQPIRWDEQPQVWG